MITFMQSLKSRLRGLITVLFGLMLSVAMTEAAAAQAVGAEVKSENFVFQGDISQNKAKRLLKDLEIFRLGLFKMIGAEPVPEETPVKIYGFRNLNMFQSVVKNKSVAGVYTKRSDGAVFVLNAQGNFKEGDQARRVAMHEYVHHIIAAHTGQKFPRWYNEGYANFLANFRIKGKKLIIGSPDQNYAWYLKNSEWMPMDILIASTKRYPFKSGSGLSSQKALQHAFYAQSWLAVTYLQTHPEEARNSGEYLRRVDKGEDSLTAFKEAMGYTPDEFGVTLKKFLGKNNFLRYPLPIEKSALKPVMTSRPLTDAELQGAIVKAQSYFN